jgi:hypothetical protein
MLVACDIGKHPCSTKGRCREEVVEGAGNAGARVGLAFYCTARRPNLQAIVYQIRPT